MHTTFTKDKEKITLTLSFLAYNLADNSAKLVWEGTSNLRYPVLKGEQGVFLFTSENVIKVLISLV